VNSASDRNRRKRRGGREYHHVNFLGGARSAGATAITLLDRACASTYPGPYFLARTSPLGAEAQQWYTLPPRVQLDCHGWQGHSRPKKARDVVVVLADERARQQHDRRQCPRRPNLIAI